MIGKKIYIYIYVNKGSQLAKGRGVQTGSGGVIFYLEGTMLARNYMDFDTVPDKKGMRWVDVHYLTQDRKHFRDYLTKKIYTIQVIGTLKNGIYNKK